MGEKGALKDTLNYKVDLKRIRSGLVQYDSMDIIDSHLYPLRHITGSYLLNRAQLGKSVTTCPPPTTAPPPSGKGDVHFTTKIK